MSLHATPSEPHRRRLTCDLQWSLLYSFLSPRVRQWVRSSHVSSWLGQENDLVDDIVQEAIVRTNEYTRRADYGEVPAVTSLQALSVVIARNYLEDLRRRDWRLTHITDDCSSRLSGVWSKCLNLAGDVADHLFLEEVIVRLPDEIARFPYKQRRALLIDLANRMHFDEQPTPLQQAFLKVGIRLQDYQIPLPVDPVMRSRHASLLSLAYGRIKKLACVKEYLEAA